MSAERGAVKVGLVGLGFMGRTHLAAWRAADERGLSSRVVAVCDPDPERRSGRAGPSGNLGDPSARLELGDARAYADPEELLADPEVELVDLCTPTPTHVPLAVQALALGKHVLVEKPPALSTDEAEELAAAAHRAGTLCMPAMCMRFWPGWDWLVERVRAGTFGAPSAATFTRLGARPAWSDFYADAQRSGGALLDLHAHDADFVRACFGEPRAVASTGTLEHLTTLYGVARGPRQLVAEGGWDLAASFPFRMRFTVCFEEATCDFDLAREPRLVVWRETGSEAVELDDETGWEREIRHLLGVLHGREPELAVTAADAVALLRLLEAERESLETGAPVEV